MTRDHDGGLDRRQTLKCMLWAGTGVVWTVAGGVPASRLIGSAKAAESGFSFVQISDSHIGFAKPANPDARATLDAAIDKILAMPGQARLHDPHRRHQPYREAGRVRRRAANDRPRQARRPLRARASTTSSIPRPATPISSASARARAAAGIRSTRAACISSRSSMSSTSRRTASARSAPSSSRGSTTTSTANPPRRRSSSSPISRSG